MAPKLPASVHIDHFQFALFLDACDDPLALRIECQRYGSSGKVAFEFSILKWQ